MRLLSVPLKPSFWTALVGAFYVAAGISLLSKRRTGALLGIVFISLEVLGRVYLVRIGTYPSRGPDFVKSVVGGAIAILVVGYVATQWKKFGADQSFNSPVETNCFDRIRRVELRRRSGGVVKSRAASGQLASFFRAPGSGHWAVA